MATTLAADLDDLGQSTKKGELKCGETNNNNMKTNSMPKKSKENICEQADEIPCKNDNGVIAAVSLPSPSLASISVSVTSKEGMSSHPISSNSTAAICSNRESDDSLTRWLPDDDTDIADNKREKDMPSLTQKNDESLSQNTRVDDQQPVIMDMETALSVLLPEYSSEREYITSPSTVTTNDDNSSSVPTKNNYWVHFRIGHAGDASALATLCRKQTQSNHRDNNDCPSKRPRPDVVATSSDKGHDEITNLDSVADTTANSCSLEHDDDQENSLTRKSSTTTPAPAHHSITESTIEDTVIHSANSQTTKNADRCVSGEERKQRASFPTGVVVESESESDIELELRLASGFGDEQTTSPAFHAILAEIYQDDCCKNDETVFLSDKDGAVSNNGIKEEEETRVLQHQNYDCKEEGEALSHLISSSSSSSPPIETTKKTNDGTTSLLLDQKRLEGFTCETKKLFLGGAAIVTLQWDDVECIRVLSVDFFYVEEERLRSISSSYPTSLVTRRLLLRLSALALATGCEALRLPP